MQRKLNILFIIPVLGCGGAEILLGNICLELNKNGHKTKVICLNEPHYTFENYPNKNKFIAVSNPEIIKYAVKISPQKLINVSSADFEKILQEFNPDVIHSHLFLSEVIAHSYHYKNAVYFSHGHDNMFQLEPVFYKTTKPRKWFNLIEKLWLTKKYKEFNNEFIAISNDTFDFFKRSLPKKMHSNIHLLHNAITTANFLQTVKKIDSKKKLNLVSIGNLVTKKNHTFLIDVAKILFDKKINFQLEILGFGYLMEELQKKIDGLNLNENVILLGNVGNIPQHLNNANIYLHPATYEPFGLVILEAMASGLPVICLNGKGNVGLNVESKTGFMIDPPDAEKFADKILYLINNPEEYSKISEYCVNFSKDYDIENYCKKLVDLYQNAIDKKHGIK
jgi:glycosyltransferase involved in cell wall biosynthesis